MPCCQGRGIGRLLLQKAERYALDKGVKALHLNTHVLMKENISLYRKIGYSAGRRVSEAGFERLYMCKLLS